MGWRRVVGVALSVAAALAVGASTPAPAATRRLSIVQLGDSIASGEGTLYGYRYDMRTRTWTGGSIDATWPGPYPACHVSPDAYGNTVAQPFPEPFGSVPPDATPDQRPRFDQNMIAGNQRLPAARIAEAGDRRRDFLCLETKAPAIIAFLSLATSEPPEAPRSNTPPPFESYRDRAPPGGGRIRRGMHPDHRRAAAPDAEFPDRE